ncbi:hypothetical protein ACN28E_34655 [Archangium lansingense]|uniref:hypothetical protein n=1 Tax=Archangium lansingense TaxID=2995310 RepID=UPI003B7E94AD
MTVLPIIITNNLGKIAATAAVTTLGIVGYVNRERISRWFTDEACDSEKQERIHGSKGVRETAESLKAYQGQMALSELDKKHAELLDKLTAMNTKTVSDFRVILNDAHAELITAMAEFEGQLDAQRSETRALGEELREKMASLMARQDTVEALVRGKDRRKGNGSAAPEARAA